MLFTQMIAGFCYVLDNAALVTAALRPGQSAGNHIKEC